MLSCKVHKIFFGIKMFVFPDHNLCVGGKCFLMQSKNEKRRKNIKINILLLYDLHESMLQSFVVPYTYFN